MKFNKSFILILMFFLCEITFHYCYSMKYFFPQNPRSNELGSTRETRFIHPAKRRGHRRMSFETHEQEKQNNIENIVSNLPQIKQQTKIFVFVDMVNFTSFCRRNYNKKIYLKYKNKKYVDPFYVCHFMRIYLDHLTYIIKYYGGKKINESGDQIFATFPPCLCNNAIKCMMELVMETEFFAIKEKNSTWKTIYCGVGANLGKTGEINGDFFGDPVNRASRYQADTRNTFQYVKNKQITETIHCCILIDKKIFDLIPRHYKIYFKHFQTELKGLGYCSVYGCTREDIKNAFKLPKLKKKKKKKRKKKSSNSNLLIRGKSCFNLL
ncbi:hypothetical protein KAT08_04670 [Candidatus Babeliales bacterium]|nr:hypothetical protein [Candidatus Babeliales bacterium]